MTRLMVMWFINENGEPYPYSVDNQSSHFPNDYHRPFATKAQAEKFAETLEPWL